MLSLSAPAHLSLLNPMQTRAGCKTSRVLIFLPDLENKAEKWRQKNSKALPQRFCNWLNNLRILFAACALCLPSVSHDGASIWGCGTRGVLGRSTGGVLGRYNSAPGFSL